jgi:hypothetical protein
MPDLDVEQVRAQLASLGLSPLDGEDLDEITHRINALREALAALEPFDLEAQEPSTTFEPEAARRGP